MNIFESIMSPFIYIIKQIFLFSYQITGDYGTAIVLLSFTISLLLLPIFIYIEKAKKKDDALKLKMKPLIDEIKRVYKGQERFYYIKTINRQHNYRSGRALIPILSLLIQIPFFIAAYQFLENFEPLKSISFLFIKDLSQPDGLFGAIHFLPIFMTLVNLLTAYFYTRNGNTSERKQMLIVAGVFLVLLFKLPSGLVLYWTMNNVFSFFRLFITNPKVFKKNNKRINFTGFISKYKLQIPTLKKVFVGILSVTFSLQLNWAFNNNFDDIYFRITGSIIVSFVFALLTGIILIYWKLFKKVLSQFEVKPIYFLLGLFLTFYFYLAAKYYFSGLNNYLTIFSILFLIPTQVISFLYSNKQIENKNPYISKILSVLLWVLLIYQILLLISYISSEDVAFNLFNSGLVVKYNSMSNFVLPGIIYILISLPFYWKLHPLKIIGISKSYLFLYVLAIIFIFGLIFFWKPLLVYASSPSVFEFPAVNILRYNYYQFLIFCILSIFIYLIFPRKYKPVLLYIVLFLFFISFINSLVIPIKLGSLQVNQFSQQENLSAPISYYILEVLFLIAVFMAIRWIFQRRFFKVTAVVLIAINILVISQSFFSAVNTGFFSATLQEKNSKNSIGIPFSQEKQNILYFFADGFQGYYIKQIMDENPELKKSFEGFKWYPNTLSQSNYTHSSMPAMFGGLEYSVSNLNKDTTHTTKEKIMGTLVPFMNKIKSKGYSFSSSEIFYINSEQVKFDNFIPFWDDSWKEWSFEVPLGEYSDVWRKRLKENALFYSAPLFLKPAIYNKTKWISFSFFEKSESKQKDENYSNKKYNFIRLLPKISVIKNNKSSFIFIHDESVHWPWNIVNDNGIMTTDVTPYKNAEWFIIRFARWIEWMKENSVYDNTKIVIVSDHGVPWGNFNMTPDVKKDVDFSDTPDWYISKSQFWSLNALLMTKDFNAKGDIKYDNRMMSNGDVPAIIFDKNNPAEIMIENRVLPTVFAGWDSDVTGVKKISIYRQYEVKNNIFDLKNWKQIKK